MSPEVPRASSVSGAFTGTGLASGSNSSSGGGVRNVATTSRGKPKSNAALTAARGAAVATTATTASPVNEADDEAASPVQPGRGKGPSKGEIGPEKVTMLKGHQLPVCDSALSQVVKPSYRSNCQQVQPCAWNPKVDDVLATGCAQKLAIC